MARWTAAVVLAEALASAGCLAPEGRLLPRPGRHHCLYVSPSVPHSCRARLADEADRHIERLLEIFHLDPPSRPVEVLVFRWRGGLLWYLLRACPSRWNAKGICLERGEGYVVALAWDGDSAAALRTLRHELTHYVVSSAFAPVPPWIDEGLAQWWEESEGENLHRVGEPSPPPSPTELERLIALPPGSKLSHRQYVLCRLLVGFLLVKEGRGGWSAVRSYLLGPLAGESPEARFKRCFGLAPAEVAARLRTS